MKLSRAAQSMPASPIRNLIPFAFAAKQRGVKVIHLNIGAPDIKAPEVMIDVLKQWNKNPIGYSDSQGERALIESLLKYYENLGVRGLSWENVQTTVGGSEGLFWTFLSLCNRGDEIITFEPFYTNYEGYANMVGAKIVPIQTTITNNFAMPASRIIEAKISSKTRAILICNPDNPTGSIYLDHELAEIIDIAKRHKLFVISDEAYREFVYTGVPLKSILHFAKSYPEGIIMVDSLSKRYSLCGARLGALVSFNADFMAACLKYGQARLSAGLVDQLVGAQLINVPQSYFDEVVSEYDRRRQAIKKGLATIDGVVCSDPQGAFYCIARLPVKDAFKFSKWLLSDFSLHGETLMVAPAAGFYKTKGLGVDEVRIAYVLNTKAMTRAVEILKAALRQYNK